jgi:molybdate transport system permease protein
MNDAIELVPLWLALKVAGFATLIAFLVGCGIAFFLARIEIRGKELIDAVMTLPMVLPPTVLGYYPIVCIGRNGPIGRWLEETFDFSLMFTWEGAVIAAAIVSLPLILKSVRAAYEGVDLNLENAAEANLLVLIASAVPV